MWTRILLSGVHVLTKCSWSWFLKKLIVEQETEIIRSELTIPPLSTACWAKLIPCCINRFPKFLSGKFLTQCLNLITDVAYHIEVDESITAYDGIWSHSITIGVSDIVATSLSKHHIRSSSSVTVTLSDDWTPELAKYFICQCGCSCVPLIYKRVVIFKYCPHACVTCNMCPLQETNTPKALLWRNWCFWISYLHQGTCDHIL